MLTIALLLVLGFETPWQTLSLDGVASVPADPSRDFTAAQLARENAYHAAVRPPAYLSLALGLAVAIVLGLTPLGARIVSRWLRRSAVAGDGACCSARSR